jgi:septal ring factor EnvC (AmiA/AmiB activator)
MTDPDLHIADELPAPQVERGAPERRIAELERELAQLRGREAGWRAERRRLLAALEAAEREVAGLPALRHEAEANRDAAYWLTLVQSSWSWRLMAPLRVLSRLGRRTRRAEPRS